MAVFESKSQSQGQSWTARLKDISAGGVTSTTDTAKPKQAGNPVANDTP